MEKDRYLKWFRSSGGLSEIVPPILGLCFMSKARRFKLSNRVALPCLNAKDQAKIPSIAAPSRSNSLPLRHVIRFNFLPYGLRCDLYLIDHIYLHWMFHDSSFISLLYLTVTDHHTLTSVEEGRRLCMIHSTD